MTPEVLSEPATNPPLANIVLVSRYLPWEIPIQASDQYVTVSDALGGLYRALRQDVTETEILLEKDDVRKQILKAFEQRCRRLERIDASRANTERKFGLRRVDFLAGNNRFRGFSRVELRERPNVFKFSVTS